MFFLCPPIVREAWLASPGEKIGPGEFHEFFDGGYQEPQELVNLALEPGVTTATLRRIRQIRRLFAQPEPQSEDEEEEETEDEDEEEEDDELDRPFG